MRSKFISPAVSTKEIDLSFVPLAVANIGAGLIGLATKGLAFNPISINNFSQYTRVFGDTSPDCFMSYAAKYYLQNQGQLTVVRVLGDKSSNGGVDIDKGFAIISSTAAALAGAELKRVIRTVDNSVTGVSASAVNGAVRLTVSYSSTTATYYADVTFDPYDPQGRFIKNVLPVNRSDARTTGNSPTAALGFSYGLYVDSIVKDVPFAASSCSAYTITNQKVGQKYRTAVSPIVVSQGFGPAGAATVYNLFKIVSRSHGDAANKDVKILISNLTFDNTKEFPYFIINVRDMGDTDNSANILLSFNVTLDPDASDYILKVIGDRFKKLITTEGTPYNKTFGDWDNKSEYIRIAHPDSTDDTFVADLPSAPSNARPQGFIGMYFSDKVMNGVGTYVPTIEYVKSQKKRTNYNDVTATGDTSKNITLGWDFTRMNNSVLLAQMHMIGSTSAQSLGTVQSKGFYIKPTTTDATPSTRSYDIADLTNAGTDLSSVNIAGGLASNVKFAFPLYNGMDGWDLNTNETPQEQVMDGDQDTRMNNAIDLFANADDIDINMLSMPGIGSGNNGRQINRLIDLCSSRGDCLAVIDLAKASSARSATLDDAINTTLTEAKSQADGFDDSYAAAFWPWIRIKDVAKLVWVPPSVAAYSVIGYNDAVAHPWFAAAGFKRGLLDFVILARQKLTKESRDTLYDRSVNPIATIKDQILVFGNRTTQKKTTALRSLLIRRGLIDLKKLIVSVAQYVLFDKNTIRSRDELLGKVTPILLTMQSQLGLNAFRVVSSPSADDVERNIMPVQIYVQFQRRVLFIPISFLVTPTGVLF